MTRHRGNILGKFPRLIGFIFLVAVPVMSFILYCILILPMNIETMNELKYKTAASKGIIVSCQIEEFYNSYARSETCLPTVDFTTASDEKIEFVSSYSMGVLFFYKGKEVTVSYNPRNSHDALITSLEFWIGLLFDVLGMCVMVLFVGFAVTTYLRPSEPLAS